MTIALLTLEPAADQSYGRINVYLGWVGVLILIHYSLLMNNVLCGRNVCIVSLLF